jgi:hypothetical protein
MDLMCILPTAGGKTLIMICAGLLLRQRYPRLVVMLVYPLLSLVEDQVLRLAKMIASIPEETDTFSFIALSGLSKFEAFEVHDLIDATALFGTAARMNTDHSHACLISFSFVTFSFTDTRNALQSWANLQEKS